MDPTVRGSCYNNVFYFFKVVGSQVLFLIVLGQIQQWLAGWRLEHLEWINTQRLDKRLHTFFLVHTISNICIGKYVFLTNYLSSHSIIVIGPQLIQIQSLICREKPKRHTDSATTCIYNHEHI